jgi:hypothetical protein
MENPFKAFTRPKNPNPLPTRGLRQKKTHNKRATKAAREIAALAAAMATGTPPDLTQTEMKAIALLSLPGALRLKPQEICDQLGIGKAMWWYLRQSPIFKAKYETIWRQALTGRIGEVIEVAIQSALRPGRDGAMDRRLVFEAAGVIKNQEGRTESSIDGGMPDAVLLWYYVKTHFPRENWVPSIRQAFDSGRLLPMTPEGQAIGSPSNQPVIPSPHPIPCTVSTANGDDDTADNPSTNLMDATDQMMDQKQASDDDNA